VERKVKDGEKITNDPIEQFHKDIEKWIINNWKPGKCKICGKDLYPIIDFTTIVMEMI